MQTYKEELKTIRKEWKQFTDINHSQRLALFHDDGLTPIYAPAIHHEQLTELNRQLQSKKDITISAIAKVEKEVKIELDQPDVSPFRKFSLTELQEKALIENELNTYVDSVPYTELAAELTAIERDPKRMSKVAQTVLIERAKYRRDHSSLDEDRTGYLPFLTALTAVTAPETERRHQREQTGKEVIVSAGQLRLDISEKWEELLRVGVPSRAMSQF